MSVLAEALSYRERGWSVIPLERGSKTPVVSWRPYQTQPPTERQVAAWWRTWPRADIGIITGSVSDLAVVDLDGPEGLAQHSRFDETAAVQTGRGRHLYFRHGAEPVGNRVGLLPHVDLRGNGGFVVAPPSQHANGVTYAWLNDAPLAPLPNWVRDACKTMQSRQQRGAQEHGHVDAPHSGPIPNGARNNTLYRLGARFLWESSGTLSTQQIESFLRQEARRCVTPLEEGELRNLVLSVAKSYRC